jgi:hypothetical protein
MEDVIQVAGLLATILVTVLGGWAGFIGLRKWEKGNAGASPRELAAVNQRLEQLELTMETMTLEMERMTESQRFTAKLLTERAASAGEPAAALREAGERPRVAEPR